jgi:hypothetical protein
MSHKAHRTLSRINVGKILHEANHIQAEEKTEDEGKILREARRKKNALPIKEQIQHLHITSSQKPYK